MEAKVFVSGNLESNAAIVYFKNGNAIIRFSIATSNYYHNHHGEVIQQPTGHDCKKYVKDVNQDLIDKLVKGAYISVYGVLRYEELSKSVAKTKNGKRSAFIEVKEIDFN